MQDDLYPCAGPVRPVRIPSGRVRVLGALLIFWLPSHLSYRVSVEYLSGNIRNVRWSQIIDTILAPYLIIPVLLESVGIHQQKFKVTDKKKRRQKTAGARYLIPHGILILLTAAALLHFVRGKYGMALVYSSVIIFWLGYNLTALIYAVLFMMGRESRRISDRIGAVEKAEITVGGRIWSGETVDVSEEGIALRITDPGAGENGKEFRIRRGETFSITVTAKYYRALLNAVCAYTRREQGGGWFVTASVSPEKRRTGGTGSRSSMTENIPSPERSIRG